MIPAEDFYQRQIDMDEYLGRPYPVAAVGAAASYAALEEMFAECWNCGDPHDDDETRLCDTCKAERATS